MSTITTSSVLLKQGTPIQAGTGTQSSVVHTAIANDIQVKSVVSTETQSAVSMESQGKINQLMNKLATTHNQIDQYAKKRLDEVSAETTNAINRVVAETQLEQQNLLLDANTRAAEIEKEYKMKLQAYVQELDNAKAQNLSVLEKDLNLRQESILETAKERIDNLQAQANAIKMNVLREAQAQEQAKVEGITDEVAALGMMDAHKRLHSTTTTVITTDTAAKPTVNLTKTDNTNNQQFNKVTETIQTKKTTVITGTEPRTSVKP